MDTMLGKKDLKTDISRLQRLSHPITCDLAGVLEAD